MKETINGCFQKETDTYRNETDMEIIRGQFERQWKRQTSWMRRRRVLLFANEECCCKVNVAVENLFRVVEAYTIRYG